MKCVGVKQVLKAVELNEVTVVYIGDDADKNITAELIEKCKEKNIEIKHVETMAKLGEMAGIEVGSAAAAE